MADADLTQQYGRVCSLIVYGSDLDNGLDLSLLRVKFAVKRSDTATPNSADIRVYNLSEQTATRIRDEFKRVILQAGYEGNLGVIFQGNIKQVIIGRESATDTFIDIIAGDGDTAYNFAVVNKTLAAGASQTDQVSAAVGSMNAHGVTAGNVGDMPPEKLPRGKVMYGSAKNYLRNAAQSSNKTWSIQDEKVTFVPLKSYLPGEAVVLTSKTGMIGTPQQTTNGVNVKCLLNPNIRVGGRVKIDNKSIEKLKLNMEQIAAAKGDVSAINKLIPQHLSNDGTYYVFMIEHQGDTRGVEWYSSLTTILTDVSANPFNSIKE
jgi:hypothetical protein